MLQQGNIRRYHLIESLRKHWGVLFDFPNQIAELSYIAYNDIIYM